MQAIFALTTRGLEDISAQELAELGGVSVRQIAYRRVLAQSDATLAPFLLLRTVDDVFLDLAHWSGVGRPRSVLAELRRRAAALELQPAAAAIAQLRPVDPRPSFSVSASFVGRRNYTSEEMKFAIAEGIETQYGWRYSDDDRSAALNIRLFIEHENALVGMRLGQRALHERSYKVKHLPGSLKPPVAAAMLRLAQLEAGQRLLDPFCGAGTILIEASQLGALTRGGDDDPIALEAARSNAQVAGVALALEQWDARNLPLAEHSMDCIVSNLPWGRQVAVDSALTMLYQQAVSEMQRVLVPGGRLVLLTSLPELVQIPELACTHQHEISLFGQIATIMVFKSLC